MKKSARISLKAAMSCCFFVAFLNLNWGQDLLLSDKVIGKVKKCILKTYSVKTIQDEHDIDELRSKESYEYFTDGAIKVITIYRDNYVMKINHLQSGKTSSVYWLFGNNYVSIARDSFVYNPMGEIEKKTTSLFFENKWIVTDIYEYQYGKSGIIDKIYHKYTSEYRDGDLRPFHRSQLHPNMSHLNLSNAMIGEIIEKLKSKIEETNDIMYREYSEEIANKPFGTKLSNLEGLSTYTEITFKREFDSFGNWTKTTLFIGRKPMRIYLRELTYYE
jgi:hypothetical protein